MHACLYVCLPRSEARTSLQARRKAFKYLEREHFVHNGRFCGRCDYFSVGGYYSGRLSLLRLRQAHPRRFRSFWKRFVEDEFKPAEARRLFQTTFPDLPKPLPILRSADPFEGHDDDAQVIDQVLWDQLKDGFGDDVTYAYDISEPDAIFTDLGDGGWDEPEDIIGNYWAVVIDYHD